MAFDRSGYWWRVAILRDEMNTTIPTAAQGTSLPAQLQQIGLPALPAQFNDFLAPPPNAAGRLINLCR
jgi:hypothetical protein